MKRHDQEWKQVKDRDKEGDQVEQMMKELDILPSDEFKEKSFSYALQGIDMARKKTRQKKRQRRAKTVKATVGMTAAAILLSLTLLSTTNHGQAFVSQIRQIFEPEKTTRQEIEGMPEDIDVTLHEGGDTITSQEAEFAIYVDEERYNVVKELDVFRIEADIPDDYPEVFMEITQQIEVKPDVAMDQINSEMEKEYKNVSEIEQIDDPVKGYQIRANNGSEWNDEVVVYYVVSNELEGSFIIKQQYFMEAAEGHGARLDQMLKDFKVVIAKDREGQK